MDNRTQEFLTRPIIPLLIRMSAPNTIAFFIQSLVVLTEVWFISRLGTNSLAAVALAFPLLMITQTMSGGALGGAITSAIARSMGADDIEKAERLIWHSIIISLGGAITFLILFLLFGKQLLFLLGGRGEILQESYAYCSILFFGGILLWLSGSLSAVLRGMGNMRFPATLMVITSSIQVILSGGFILGWFGFPKLGVPGAAVAVLISSALMVTVILLKLRSKSIPASLRKERFQLKKFLFDNIFEVAIPASLSPLLVVGTILVLTGLVGRFGTEALAGYGIGSRVEFLMIPLIFGIGSAMTSIVGANIGALNIDRAEKVGILGGSTAGFVSILIGLTLAAFPEAWIQFFTDDIKAFEVTKKYIQIVGPFYIFQGIGLSLYFASQGANAMKWPTIATIARFIIACAGGGVSVYWLELGIESIFISSSAAMAIFGLMIFISIKKGAWRKNL
ncbi:MATE family efflux transporter [Gammaproteobacteria bacterium]|nr:MATE family efflux transporter [Gammaproteobacteria bacterium]